MGDGAAGGERSREDAAHTPDPARRGCCLDCAVGSHRRLWWCCLTCTAYRHLSPFDEIGPPRLPRQGAGRSTWSAGASWSATAAMREQACRGHDLAEFAAAAMRHEGDACEPVPLRLAYNTAYPDPPAYYVVTAAVRHVWSRRCPGSTTSSLPPAPWESIWLGAGLAAHLPRWRCRLGANRWSAAGTTLHRWPALPPWPTQSATITSDAPEPWSWACRPLPGRPGRRREARPARWWLAPAAAATTAVKATGLTVVGLVAVFLLLYLARQSRDPITTPDPADDRADERAPEQVSGPARPRRRPRPPCGAAPSHRVAGHRRRAAARPVRCWPYATLVNALDRPAGCGRHPTMRGYFHVDSIGYDELDRRRASGT